MNFPLGFLVVIGLVVSGYILSGGNLDIIILALPYEGMMIVGMAVGSTIIANSFRSQRKIFSGIGRILRGEKWKKRDYEDALLLMYELATIKARHGVKRLGEVAEEPEQSSVFAKYPRIAADPFAVSIISDTVMLMTLDQINEHTAEDLIKKRLKTHQDSAIEPASALSTLADALPAIGIVAAVLGVIKTMGAVDSPPAILGEKIAGALVGTMLGVFLSYGLVGPLARRLQQIEKKDGAFYHVIANCLVSIVCNDKTLISIERGRGSIPDGLEPSFAEIEEKARAMSI